MLLTNEKIEVTQEMMEKEGLSRFAGHEYAIPHIPNGESHSIIFKRHLDLTIEDLDKIEEYFIWKNKN